MHPLLQFRLAVSCFSLVIPLAALPVAAEDEYEHPPISYSATEADNCVTQLQSRIDAGKFELKYDGQHGYLKDVLRGLEVPIESQILVFSKTSLQVRCISPRAPRAIYFNDDVYIGFCQSGEVLEIAAVDRQLGTVFYTLNQEPSPTPKFERRVENCLVCHSSSRTEGVPGHLVRSLYVDTEGTPLLSSGNRVVDHTTPLAQRWGGWYVTGTHGSQKHLGNLLINARRVAEPVDNTAGQNVTSLADHFAVNDYLAPHSDIVALMVAEHQTLVHNRITKANFATRQALASEQTINQMLNNPKGTRLDSTTRRIQSAGDKLVDALLFVGETPLTEPIRGTSGFERKSTETAPRDQHGRSLRDLDLQTRLFKYPCSYLIYSEAFSSLPPDVKDYVWQRLHRVLTSEKQSEEFSHLSQIDRTAILEILRETTTDLPDYFR